MGNGVSTSHSKVEQEGPRTLLGCTHKSSAPRGVSRYILESLETQHGTILAKLLEFQQQEVFGDLKVKLKDGQIRAMSALMAAMSPVFDIMLRTEMKEKKSGEVELCEVSRETWNCIVHFYFSSEKLLTEDNICEVLCVCNMYQMEEMKTYCDDLLASFCTPENCLSLQKIAKEFLLPVSSAKIAQYIAENFAELTKTEAFLAQDVDDILELLNNPNVVTTEDDLCQCVLRWLRANQSSEEIAAKIFGELRLWRMSSEFLFQNVIYNGIVTNNDILKKSIRDEVKTRVHRPESSRQFQTVPQRRGLPIPPMDLVILGHDSKNTYFFSCSSKNREWKRMSHGPKKSRCAAVAMNNTIIVTGGYEDTEKRSTQMFHTESKSWSKGPNLIEGRYDHGMVVLEGTAYVVGGSIPNQRVPHASFIPSGQSIRLSSIEELSKDATQWEHRGNLQIPASEFGVATLKTKIIVAGNTPATETQNLIQAFDVSTSTATVLETKLSCCIYPVRGVSLGDTVYFLGEYGDLVRVQELEGGIQGTRHVKLARYGSRYRCGLHYSNQHLWVLGGHSNGFLSSVRCYDLNGKEEDSSSIQSLPTPMEVCAICSVKIPEVCMGETSASK